MLFNLLLKRLNVRVMFKKDGEPHTRHSQAKNTEQQFPRPSSSFTLFISVLWVSRVYVSSYLPFPTVLWPVGIQAHTGNHMRLTHCLVLSLGPLGNWALRHSALWWRGSGRRMTLRQLDTWVVRNPPSGGFKKKQQPKTLACSSWVLPSLLPWDQRSSQTLSALSGPHRVTLPRCTWRKRSSD